MKITLYVLALAIISIAYSVKLELDIEDLQKHVQECACHEKK
jgi:hypothetical protein